jgi:hypothetical protein
MSYQRTLRAPSDHSLSVLAEMSGKDRPAAVMVLPLSKGAVAPVDASGFAGVEFEARGEGGYALVLRARDGQSRSPFEATPKWERVRLPFSAFKAPKPGQLTAIEFEIARPAGAKAFLEIDNVRFYAQ